MTAQTATLKTAKTLKLNINLTVDSEMNVMAVVAVIALIVSGNAWTLIPAAFVSAGIAFGMRN